MGTIKESKFETFEWLDIQNPSEEEARSLTLIHGLDPILVQDSLQHGHLPKIEPTEKGMFMILRAYRREKEKPTTINDFSNKVAFFVERSGFKYFGYYRILLGVVFLLFIGEL